MKTTAVRLNPLALICAFFFVVSILACLSPDASAQPGHLIRRKRQEVQQKQQQEKNKEKEKDKDKDKKEKKDKSSESKAVKYHYHHYRDKRYHHHYKFWVPSYQRVVNIYFHEAYAELNEGFFFDAKNGIEYLPREWFDIVLNFECYAVVNGEDVKIRYNIFTEDGEELHFGKEFCSIFNGINEKRLGRAFPKSYLDTYRKLYFDIILTIEGNDAYGGFWLEALPSGNEGPLRIGDVIVSDTYYGAESKPLYNLKEGEQYKLWAEYEVDYYIADSATVEWHLFDLNGRDITGEQLYIDPRPGYSVFSTTFIVPELHFAGTRDCYLDVSITAPPYIGRRILEINVTGDQIVNLDSSGGYEEESSVPYKGSTPWDVTFVYTDVVTLGSAEQAKELYAGEDLYGMFEYIISGLQHESDEHLKWELQDPEGLKYFGEETTRVNDGTQHRYIKLPIQSHDPGGRYYLNIEIWIDNLFTRGAQATFELNANPDRIKVEIEGADENYYEFPGLTLFLPYTWDVTKDNGGLTFISADGVVGSLNAFPLHKADHEGESLEDMATAYEPESGVKLTSVKDVISRHEILSTSYIRANEQGVDMVDLYAYFTIDRTEETFDFWILKMSVESSKLRALYDDYRVFKEGLFFP